MVSNSSEFVEESQNDLLESCCVMSLPTKGDGYAGALYVFVRRFFLMHKRTARASEIRMMVPNTAPTMAAIGAGCA